MLALAAALALGRPAFSQSSARPEIDVLDPVYVFYSRGSCLGHAFELEVWDREQRDWVAHPFHPQVDVDSCQLEDAGGLLNEIRRRCLEPPGSPQPPPWIVGLDVFNPRVMERCEVTARTAPAEVVIQIDRGGPGEVVRGDQKRIPIEGRVRVGGAASTDATVVIAIDRSGRVRDAGVDALLAQTEAAAAFVRRHRAQLGSLRIGLVVHPNMPPAPGSRGGTAARWLVEPTDEPERLIRALTRLGRRGPAGVASETAALRFAIDELVRSETRKGAARHLLFAIDGRHRDLFGAMGRDDPNVRSKLEALGRRAAEAEVALHLFSLGGLADQPPAFVQEIVREAGSVSRVLRDGLSAPFFLRVRIPFVEEVRVANVTLEPDPLPAALDASGRFRIHVDAASGENRLLAEARLSDGRRGEMEWLVTFDDGAIRARLQAVEAERIRRLRERSVEIEAERDP